MISLPFAVQEHMIISLLESQRSSSRAPLRADIAAPGSVAALVNPLLGIHIQ